MLIGKKKLFSYLKVAAITTFEGTKWRRLNNALLFSFSKLPKLFFIFSANYI